MAVIRLLLALLLATPAAAQPMRLVWAWERPEALQALPAGIGVAVVTGFVRLAGGQVAVSRGRRFPLLAFRPPDVAVAHVEIDQSRPLDWSPALRDATVAAVLGFVRGFVHVQLDMEVRASQRAALLEVLAALRAGLPPGTTLSMTALASWCDTEHWLDAAPVDEIVPMLFRMGRGGVGLRARLGAGGDLAEPRCRAAAGIATDTPQRVPAGRRVYIFNPRPWDAAALASLQPG